MTVEETRRHNLNDRRFRKVALFLVEVFLCIALAGAFAAGYVQQ